MACMSVAVGCEMSAHSREGAARADHSPNPTRVVILRHAEKPVDESDPHLSEAGRQHALKWAGVLTDPKGPLGGAVPAALFAPHPTRHRASQRPMETLRPLATQLGQSIRTPFSAREVGRLAAKVRQDHTGQTVVICWVHEFLPDLARAFGVTAGLPAWKGGDFDQVWVIEYPGGRANLRIEHPNSTGPNPNP